MLDCASAALSAAEAQAPVLVALQSRPKLSQVHCSIGSSAWEVSRGGIRDFADLE